MMSQPRIYMQWEIFTIRGSSGYPPLPITPCSQWKYVQLMIRDGSVHLKRRRRRRRFDVVMTLSLRRVLVEKL